MAQSGKFRVLKITTDRRASKETSEIRVVSQIELADGRNNAPAAFCVHCQSHKVAKCLRSAIGFARIERIKDKIRRFQPWPVRQDIWHVMRKVKIEAEGPQAFRVQTIHREKNHISALVLEALGKVVQGT